MSSATNTTKKRRRITLIAFAAAAALALTPIMIMAQHGDGHGPHRGHDGRGHMIERMFERLDLTDDQKDAVHSTMSQHREQTRTLLEEKIAGRRALGETIHADFFDESAVRQAAADLAAVDADLAVMKAQMFQEINKVLTTEQRERMKELIEDWHFMADEYRGRRSGKGPGPASSE
jgi:Spy/CpxP family protein refolding chaperone